MQHIISNPDHEVVSGGRFKIVKNPTAILYHHPFNPDYTYQVMVCRRKDFSIEVSWDAVGKSGVCVPPQRTFTTAMQGYYLAYRQVMDLYKTEGNVLAWVKFQASYLSRFADVLRFEFELPEVEVVV